MLVAIGVLGIRWRARFRARERELVAHNRRLEREIADLRRDEEEALRFLEQQAQAGKIEAMSALAAGIAHDFNNLFMVVSAHAALIKEELPDHDESRSSISIMEDAVAQASGLTRSLLTFSHDRADPTPVNLVAAVEHAVRKLARLLPASVELGVDLRCRPAPWIRGEAGQVEQIVLNLGANALEAMPDGGTLRVAVISIPLDPGRERSTTQLVIADTGSGIAQETLPKIFDPFFSTKWGGRGTGLGLTLSRGIAERHGGRIDVRTRSGDGTAFVITFPTVPRPDVDDSETADATRGTGQRILIAEDRQQFREVLASYLSSAGYEIVQAADGKTALASVRRLRPNLDLLLLDLDSPRPIGLELVRRIREDGDETPVIVMTGDPGAISQHPRVTVMTKPFRLERLGRLVPRVLGTARMRNPA
jgi:signal transduction histidine kinase